MVAFVNLYSKNKGELNNFLSKFYNNNLKINLYYSNAYHPLIQ